MLLLVLLAGVALLPTVLHLDSSAYPSEPEKRMALDRCSRSEPTFVRFLPSERTKCYERIANLTVATANVLPQQERRRPVVNQPTTR
jgi:hypothetical protein